MKHSQLSRLLAGTSAAAPASTGLLLGSPAHAASAQPMFSYTHGWRVDQHPRALGDVNGDGAADVVGFGHRGVSVAHSGPGRSFTPVSVEVDDFGTVQGWRGTGACAPSPMSTRSRTWSASATPGSTWPAER